MNKAAAIFNAALNWTLRRPLGRSQWITLIVWALLLAAGMVEFGDQISKATNLDSELYDQGAYLRVAEQNRNAWWPTVTDGIRNPLFPWLLAMIDGGAADSMFGAGLHLNVRLGAVLVVVLAWWAGRSLAWLPAMAFATISVAVVLPLSTYVGTEVLFYGLFFAAWMQVFRLFEKLTLIRCAFFGATLAVAYLAKPGVTLLSACFVMVGLGIWLRARKRGKPEGWTGIGPWTGAVLAVGIFGLLICPRAMNAWKQFGDPLQNTAARCFWAEDWSKCYPILGYLNPRFIERIPTEERPSASRYLSPHGWADAWNRIIKGIAVQSDNLFSVDQKSLWFDRKPSAKRPVRRIFPYRGFLLLPPAALLLGFWFATRRRPDPPRVDFSDWAKTVFALLLVGLSFGAFSWYAVIAPGARFIIALYLPVLASLALAAEHLRRQLSSRWSDYVAAGTWLLMLGFMATHLVLIAAHPHFDKLKGAF